ncbi:hypothetical protein KBI33_03540 [Candidatus Shapirobacteria bacterium]|nr:hypothetical protein [Candidatus Shapirobacteria bacterium]
MTKTAKALPWLGVVAVKKAVLIFGRHPQEKNLFLVLKSKNGLDFSPFKAWAEIIDQKGQPEEIKKTSDFNLTRLNNRYFLTYLKEEKKGKVLNGAFWSGFSHWQKMGPWPNITKPSFIAPNYQWEKKHVLFFGGREVKIATTNTLKKWQVGKRIYPSKPLTVGQEIRVGQVFKAKKGLVLFYSQKTGLSNQCRLGALLLDSQKPTKVIKKEKLWEGEWKEKVSFLGMVVLGSRLLTYWQDKQGEIFALNLPYLPPAIQSDKKDFSAPLVSRYRDNPILEPINTHKWESKAVFNSAVFTDQEKIHLIYRAVGEDDISVWGYASTKDGFQIEERLEKPIYAPREDFEGGVRRPASFYRPTLSCGSGYGGCEDPRATLIENRLYFTYTAFDGGNPPRVALTSIDVDDFRHQRWRWRQPVLLSPPGQTNKNWVLFPQKIKGKYALLHSISPKILIDYLDDLNFDGHTFIKSNYDGQAPGALWESRIRGVGTPPILTDLGWLIFYHAMDKKEPYFYKIGAMILDKDDPTRIRWRSYQPVLEPREVYETTGIKPGIVYTCGAALFQKNLLLYYGASDNILAVASAPAEEFLEKMRSGGQPRLEPKRMKVNYRLPTPRTQF